jgi:hypothetical protein
MKKNKKDKYLKIGLTIIVIILLIYLFYPSKQMIGEERITVELNDNFIPLIDEKEFDVAFDRFEGGFAPDNMEEIEKEAKE